MTCLECSGNHGFYDSADGNRYLSDTEDGTPWQRCPWCNGSGKEPAVQQVCIDVLKEARGIIADEWTNTCGLFGEGAECCKRIDVLLDKLGATP